MLRDSETIAMVEDLLGRADLAMVNTLNIAARAIEHESQKRVPKDLPEEHQARVERAAGATYPPEPLAESVSVIPATEGDHVAQVVYDSPYAAAQEVGHMMYESKGGREVEWRAEHYTTPGTGPHYLEDAGKLVMAQVPEELAIQGRIAFGEIPGLGASRSDLQAAGAREEAAVPTTFPPTLQ